MCSECHSNVAELQYLKSDEIDYNSWYIGWDGTFWLGWVNIYENLRVTKSLYRRHLVKLHVNGIHYANVSVGFSSLPQTSVIKSIHTDYMFVLAETVPIPVVIQALAQGDFKQLQTVQRIYSDSILSELLEEDLRATIATKERSNIVISPYMTCIGVVLQSLSVFNLVCPEAFKNAVLFARNNRDLCDCLTVTQLTSLISDQFGIV